MKEVIAVIRRNKYYKTKEALIENHFYSLSAIDVLGRGKNGVHYHTGNDDPIDLKDQHPFVAKKLLEIYCRDEDVDDLIDTIIKANQTKNPGDGKIFVTDIEESIRIRTGETGNNAIM